MTHHAGHLATALATPLAALLATTLSLPCIAQQALNRVDVGIAHSSLTQGQPNGQAAYVRASLPDAAGATYLELMHRRAFDQHAQLASVGRVHDLDADWLLGGFATVSAPGDFLPHSKLDVTLTRKLLPGRTLLWMGGLSRAVNHRGYRDEAVQTALTWLPPGPLWGELGLRHTTSRPGAVQGERYWATVGWRQAQQRDVALRLESGQEGWSVLGNQANVVGFDSTLWNLGWSEWLGERHGIKASIERYRNPYYSRLTLDIAFFQQF